MGNGLKIQESEFEGLSNKEKLTILYKNTEQLKEMVRSYKFHQKMQWGSIGALFILIGSGRFIGVL